LKKPNTKLVRCSALYQIKSYNPQLKRFTVNSLDFRFCNITCQVENFRVSFRLNVFLCTSIQKTTLKKSIYHLFIIHNTINLIFIGQGVDYWGCESHLKPTLSHFRVNITLLNVITYWSSFTFLQILPLHAKYL
jgi:hypothetical protein